MNWEYNHFTVFGHWLASFDPSQRKEILLLTRLLSDSEISKLQASNFVNCGGNYWQSIDSTCSHDEENITRVQKRDMVRTCMLIY